MRSNTNRISSGEWLEISARRCGADLWAELLKVHRSSLSLWVMGAHCRLLIFQGSCQTEWRDISQLACTFRQSMRQETGRRKKMPDDGVKNTGSTQKTETGQGLESNCSVSFAARSTFTCARIDPAVLPFTSRRISRAFRSGIFSIRAAASSAGMLS